MHLISYCLFNLLNFMHIHTITFISKFNNKINKLLILNLSISKNDKYDNLKSILIVSKILPII